MSNKKKLLFNAVAGLLNQVITLLCGIILPPILIRHYGSATNGLISSITQFIELINFADLGVISVAESALYSPIVSKNTYKISTILSSARQFFRKIAILLTFYVIALLLIYPHVIGNQFDSMHTAVLIVILSVSTFFQYYMCLTYRILLSADQRNYLYLGIETFCVILNTALSIVLIQLGFSILIVKLIVALVYLLRPIILVIYVNRHYLIDWKVQYTHEPIQQKWNGLAQHISFIVLRNTDVVVLTLFSTLSNVSIYHVHILVVAGIRNLINSITSGIQPFFGNLIAKNENDILRNTFNIYEVGFHFMSTLFFACANTLFISFVTVYTKNIYDLKYTQPLFSSVLVLAYWALTIRTPYQNIVFSAGHFKQTQSSSILEAMINIIVSIIMVKKFGLVGVAIGTLIAMVYRTVYLVTYIEDKIISHPSTLFIKNIIGDFCIFLISFILRKFALITSLTYASWIILAVKMFIILTLTSFIIFAVFNRFYFFKLCKLITRRVLIPRRN